MRVILFGGNSWLEGKSKGTSILTHTMLIPPRSNHSKAPKPSANRGRITAEIPMDSRSFHRVSLDPQGRTPNPFWAFLYLPRNRVTEGSKSKPRPRPVKTTRNLELKRRAAPSQTLRAPYPPAALAKPQLRAIGLQKKFGVLTCQQLDVLLLLWPFVEHSKAAR